MLQIKRIGIYIPKLKKDIHWFCTNCDMAAMESVITDKDIEAKINKYMKDFNEKISELDNKLIDKLDKKEFDTKMETFKNKNSEIITNSKGELQELKRGFDNRHTKTNTNLTELFEKDISEFVDNKLSENTLLSKVIHEESWAEIAAKAVNCKFKQTEVTQVKISVKEVMDTISIKRSREDQKNNIIIYRAKESEADTLAGKHKDDIAFYIILIEVILDIPCQESDFKRVFRVGKKKEGEDRPLLVEFKNSITKNKMLESLSKLKTAQEKFRKLSIAHDLTKIERNEVKKIVEEAKEKKEHTVKGNTYTGFEEIQEIRGS